MNPTEIRVATFTHYYPSQPVLTIARSIGASEDDTRTALYQLAQCGIVAWNGAGYFPTGVFDPEASWAA